MYLASTAPDWAFINPKEYFDYNRATGSNAIACQAYTHGGYAFYPTKLGPVAPGPGSELLPRLYELAKKAGLPFWSYFCVGIDITLSSLRPNWRIPADHPEILGEGIFLGPESPWTDLLCARIREFLTDYPVDWMLFDWFVYGNTSPDTYRVQPVWFAEEPFKEIIGRPMPGHAREISDEENLRYKREVLSRQFRRIRDAVRETSPGTRIIFNVPYQRAAEPLWVGHPMLDESDGLFAECSRSEVLDWLLSVRKPHQRVMTTIIGRMEKGECDPGSWRHWYDKDCDFFGYAWGTPPQVRAHPFYDEGLKVIRQAFHAMKQR
ncbi:MAG: hypothetical protein V2A65_01845 [Candidatus Omnitrophota bacterium]